MNHLLKIAWCMAIVTILQIQLSRAQSVTSFTLINADSDTALFELNDGDIINLNDLPTTNLNVVANVSSAPVGSVVFLLNGATFRTESVAPYALAGDNSGNYLNWTPNLGVNQIEAIPYSGSGGTGTPGNALSIAVDFTDQPIDIVVTDVTFTNCPASELVVGDTIDLEVLIEPANATNQTIAFTASDGSSVDYLSGEFIASSAGTVTVTATSLSDGAVFDQCVINILDPTANTVDPYSTVEAESYTSQNGTRLVQGNTAVGYINNNDYIQFDNVDFGRGPLSGQVIGSSAKAGGTIEFRTGSQTGLLIATATIPNTGGWRNYDTFNINVIDADQYANGTSFLGTENLYLVFKGGNGSLFNVDQFIFTDADVIIQDLSFTNCPTSSLTVGDTIDLDVLITPANTTNQTIAFTASDGTSVDFLSGEFIASAPGTVTVTATSFSDGSVFDQCVITILPDTSTNTINPYSTVQAEDFTGQNGIQLSGGGSAVGYINNNDFIRFDNVEFGSGPLTGQVQASSDRFGGTIEFRIDNENGPLIATADVTNTGGWRTFQPFDINIVNPDDYANGTVFLGTQTLYLVFKGGSGFLLDVDEFVFNDSEVVIQDLSFVNCPTSPLMLGDTLDLDVLITPSNTTNQTIAFTASDGTSVDFLSGEFVASTLGINTVTATSFSDGSVSAQCEITVVDALPQVEISGELKKWHKVTLAFRGPSTSEIASDNPFLNYRLQVTFTNGGESYTVPGYYAADGDAANSSAESGNVWKVHFAPDQIGQWNYSVSFRQGNEIAISTDPSSGVPTSFDGLSGSFDISDTDKTGRDFRGKGRLEYVGEHYLKFADSGEYFIKAGADAPENTFAYDDFDATPNRSGRRKSWSPHATDFSLSDAGEYTWGTVEADGQRQKGRELLGVLKYLSDEEMNVFSFLTFSLNGDDGNVYPQLAQTNNATDWSNVYHTRFDVSKLAQWERILEYADKKGIYIHFKTQETENDQRMDGGQLGVERKLYYRELIARFGHHLALNWNLGEENDIWTELGDPNNDIVRSYAQYISDLDPYQHHIVIHTYPGQQDEVYDPLLQTSSALTGPSVQSGINNIHADVRRWVEASNNAGRKWVVANDEQGGANAGVAVDAAYPDASLPESRNVDDNRKDVRHKVLWGTLMAGGAGVEYYYGYQTGCDDLDCQDHRTRQTKWNDARIALSFFNNYLQPHLDQMVSNDGLTSVNNDYVFAKSDEVYTIYLPNGGTTDINLSAASGQFAVQWYNPRTGGNLQNGTVATVNASPASSIGLPPSQTAEDWVALLTKTTPANLNVLVYHETNGFRHGSINAGINMINDFASQEGWTVTTSQTSDVFNTVNLAQTDVVIWLNTSGNGLLSGTEQDAFEAYIRNGGGYVGVHAATDTYRDGSWPWYNDLAGAIVQTSPNHTANNTNATMDVVGNHPAVTHLGTTWNKSEEYYYWERNGGYLFSGNINLLNVRSTGGNSYDSPRPITWYKEYDGGRSFYTALGHNSADYQSNDNFKVMMREAIIWASGAGASQSNIFDVNTKLSSSLKVYPNPSNGHFTIAPEELAGQEKMEMEIRRMNGSLVATKEVQPDRNEVDVTYLENGVYLIFLKGVDTVKKQILIINR